MYILAEVAIDRDPLFSVSLGGCRRYCLWSFSDIAAEQLVTDSIAGTEVMQAKHRSKLCKALGMELSKSS